MKNYEQIKKDIEIGREYDRAISAAYDAADSQDIDRLYFHIGQIVKIHAAGELTDREAISALRSI